MKTSKKSLVVFTLLLTTLGLNRVLGQTVTFSTPGTTTWTVPSCVTSITVQVWGGGGGGGASDSYINGGIMGDEACSAAGGGGGGGYATRTYSVTSGQSYSITVGSGGTGGLPGGTGTTGTNLNNGNSGGSSTFSGPATIPYGTLTATGGLGGGGARAYQNNSGFGHVGFNGIGGTGGGGSNGTFNYNGGTGSTGAHSGSCHDLSGPGGGAAGGGGPGGAGTTLVCWGGVAGGLGNGIGGNGADGIQGSFCTGCQDPYSGNSGFTYGGGGGGALIHLNNWNNTWIRANGGTGANGVVIITYTVSNTPDPTVNQISATCTADGSASITLVGGTTYTFQEPGVNYNPITGAITVPTIPGTYHVIANNGSCDSNPISFTIQQKLPTPSDPSPSSQSFCGAKTVADLSPSGSGYNWYAASSGGSPLSAGTSLTNGTTYYVSAVSGGCESGRVGSSVTINTPGNAGTISGTSTVCAGGTIPLSTTGTGGTWASSNTGIATVSSPNNTTSNTISTSSNGSATITYTVPANGACPQVQASYPITINAVPSDPSPSSQSFCGAKTVADLSPSGAGYNWYAASTGGTPLAGGTSLTNGTTYYVSAVSGGCESGRASSLVTINTPGNAGTISGTSAVCAGGTIPLSTTGTGGTWASSNTGIATVSLPNNTTSNTITTTANGTATITYTVPASGACPQVQASYPITINAVPSDPTPSPQSFCGAKTVADLSPSGAGYNWYAASTGGTPLAGGTSLTNGTTYYVSAVSGGCESGRASSLVTINTPGNAGTISGTSAVCAGGTIPLSTTGTGGTWSSSNPSVASVNSSTGLVTSASNGSATISYTVSGVGACPDAIATYPITINPLPTANAGAMATAVCENGTIELTGGPASGVSYSWTGPGSYTSSNQNPTITPATSADGGDYHLTVTDITTSCISAQSDVTITVNSNPSISGSGIVSPADCGGSNGAVTGYLGNGGTPGYTYVWTDLIGTIVGNSADLSGVSNGTYILTVTDSKNCTDTIHATVTNPTAPANPTVNAIAATCTANGSAQIGSYTGTAGDYSFSQGGSPISTPTIASDGSFALTPGNYSVTVTVAGCISGATPFSIATQLPAPIANAGALATSVCENGTIELTGGPSSGVTYSWTGPGTYTSTSQNPTITPATSADGGDYHLTVTDITTLCSSAQSDVTISVNPLPTVVVDAAATTDPTACSGTDGQITLDFTNVTAGIYTVYYNGGANSFTNVTVDASGHAVITGLGAGTYSGLYIENSNSCQSTTNPSVTLSDPGAPSAPVIATTTPATCTAAGTSSVNGFTGTASDYTFSDPSVSVNASGEITGATPGVSYTVTVSVAGCTSGSTSFIVDTIKPSPIVAITPDVAGAICSGSPITMTGSGANNYSWSVGTTNVGSAPSLTVSPTSITTYQLVGTATNGCTDTTDYIVNINPLPNVGVTSDIASGIYCNGTGAILTASGAVTYNWQTPSGGNATGSTLNVSPVNTTNSGWYYVTGTDNNGCTSSDSVKIASSTAGLTASGDSLVCPGETANFSVSPAATSYSWTGPNGFASNNQNFTISGAKPDNSGWYHVTITDSLGCTGTDSTYLSVTPNSKCFKIPNLITPNNDNQNETWKIPGLGSASVQIYNRWGNLVYENENYQNNWAGEINSGLTIDGGGKVPVGTYFYILKVKDLPDKPTYKGYIEVQY